MVHPNAPLTPEGRRRLAVLIVDEGWTLRRAAERFRCSPATASRWATRYRAGEPLAVIHARGSDDGACFQVSRAFEICPERP